MLLLVLDKQSTAEDLSQLCWVLNESRKNRDCQDANLKWKIAQLAATSEELYEQFLEEFKLEPVPLKENYLNYFQTIYSVYPDKSEPLLSYAFNIAGGIDSARYKDFKLDEKFKKELSLLTRKILNLLHEKRDSGKEEH